VTGKSGRTEASGRFGIWRPGQLALCCKCPSREEQQEQQCLFPPTFGCRCCVRDPESCGRVTRTTERSQRFTDQRECKLCCYDDFYKTSLASRSFVCIPIVCFAKKQRSTRWSLLNCFDIVVVGRLLKQKRVSIRFLFVERKTRGGNVLSLSLSRLPLALDVVGK
jgi:hypothetical protein